MTQHIVDQEARDMARAVDARMTGHERECAIYRANTITTLKDIKNILAWGISSLIASMGGLIWYLATHPPH